MPTAPPPPRAVCDVDALAGRPVFCSWSGGKDSALALHEAVRAGARPERLLTMMIEGGERSRSHGLPRAVLAAQAAAMGVPIRFGSASWGDYEQELTGLVRAARSDGLAAGVFGDIDIEDHRAWVASVCERAGARACLPLWQRPRAAVVDDLLAAGFRAVFVAVRDGVLPRELLGRELDAAALEIVAQAGADLAGERGEYHSVVVDGPLFAHPVGLRLGAPSLRDGVWFQDVAVAG